MHLLDFGQSEGGTKFWAGVVNGTGRGENEATQSVDSNSFKDVYAPRQELGEHFVGGFVYYGRTERSLAETGGFEDRFVRVGGDALVNLTRVIAYGMALHGRDDDPLGTGERRTFYGGFAERDLCLTDRTVVLTCLDAVHQSFPAPFATSESEEGKTALFRVNTFAFTPGSSSCDPISSWGSSTRYVKCATRIAQPRNCTSASNGRM